MPQAVQARVLGLASLRHHSRSDLDGSQAARDDVRMIFDVALSGREAKAKLALGTGKPPLAQCIHQDRRHRNVALASLALGLADYLELIGALAHMQDGLLEIDVLPSQPANLRRP